MGPEDPELPGGDFLVVFNKELQGRWTCRILSNETYIFNEKVQGKWTCRILSNIQA